MRTNGALSHGRSGQLPDYYEILGVPEDASRREIEIAYWRQASGTDRREGLALLNKAYEVLGSHQRRQAYDARRRTEGVAAEAPSGEPPSPANPGLRRKLQWFDH